MPHFTSCSEHDGYDEWVCQSCGKVLCSGCVPSEWRPDITGSKSFGNICPTCILSYNNKKSATELILVKKKRVKKVKEVEAVGKKWTVTDVKRLLCDREDARLKALLLIFNYQTAEEKQIEATYNKNNVGFSGADGKILTSFAKQYSKFRSLSTKQLTILQKKMPKYASQIFRIMSNQQ